MAEKQKDDGQKPDTGRKKQDALSDVLKSVMPVLVPIAAKLMIDLIPSGSKLEDFLKHYKEYWDKVAPAVSTTVLRLTNMPDIVDDIMAELSAEVARAIKEKYKEEGEKKSFKAKDAASVRELIGLLRSEDFAKLIELISTKDDSSINKFFEYTFDLKQAEAIMVLTTLAQSTQTNFDIWFKSNFPETEAKPQAEQFSLGKEIKKLYVSIADNPQLKRVFADVSNKFNDIKRSYENTLAEPTIFEKIGNKLDIFNLRKLFNVERRY